MLLAGLLLVFAALGVPLAAQDNNPTPPNPDAETPADSQLAGTVRTPDGTAIPGATLRVIETATGKAWITWTDENGSFEFPALPAGHFRMETSQLGFAPASKEIDLASGVKTPADLRLQVGTLAAISAPPVAPSGSNSPGTAPANESASNASSSTPPAGSAATPPPASPSTSASNNSSSASANGTNGGGGNRGQRSGGPGGARNGQPGGNGQGGGRRAFQQVGLNGQNQNPAESGAEDSNIAETGGQLGQAASADAVQMIGTVAMGQAPAGGFPQPGDGGTGGPETQIGMANGANAIPGQGAPGGFGGPGGGPGGGGFGGGFAGRGGGGPRGRGPQGGAQGVGALWGAQRVMRQRINRVHYSIYDTFGDSALNARPYSLYQANPPKVSGWNEQAGMNIGGPLKIPHVYDGTDKTFFYLNFGGSWSRTPVDQFSTVPTVAERNGDFSADNVLLYNPLSNLNGPRSLMTNAGCFQATPSSPLPPAGTCIPTNLISPQSASLLSYIPLPNLPTTNIAGQNFNYHLQTNVPSVGNRLNVNVTHQISSKLSFQVNYNLSNATSHSISSFPGIEGNGYTRGQSATVGLTQNWTKTFMHTSQLYFSRTRTLGTNEFTNLTDISATLGCTGSISPTCGIQGISANPNDYGLPSINFTNFTGLNDPNFSLARSQTYRYVDSFRWMKAKHTVSAGFEVRKIDINRDTDPLPNGTFAFTGLMTSQLTSGGAPVVSPANCQTVTSAGPCIGNDFADFLLGYPGNTKLQYGDTATYFRNWGFIGYASDDWHVFPKFTVTFGVRYEAFTPPTEVNGHIANLAVSPGFTAAQCVTPVATGNCIAGPNQSLFFGHYNNWAPRLGIAWQPPGKWFSGQHQLTLRAGYSMFYVESYLNTLAAIMANQPPFATASTLTQQGFTTAPLSFQTNLASAVPGALTNTAGVNPNYQVPYAMVWNGGVEYNLTRSLFLEVMYTGTRGIHLDELLGFNPVTSGTAKTEGFTYDTTGAFSNFNALQVRLQKRMSRGLGFTLRYTYSKSLDDASTIGGSSVTVIQNTFDPRGDYGLSTFNMTHQFLGNASYQLPFGDRQRFATKGWQKSVFGQWRTNISTTANSGTPLTIRVFSKNQACQSVPGTNSERANQSGDPALADPSILEWFNTAAFSIPTSCFGDAPRNSVIGPGTFTINLGVTKTIPFGRDGLRRLEFTWNGSNLLNHPNWGGVSTVLGSKTFGQITSVGAMRAMVFTTRLNF
ncbi:MAG TPA: TonB-dependent receptor [Candidatus Acidoferrales bacterium]|nr:TonB-dependent receptor [Candidatus Acidoferrales bacterium]